MDIQLEKKKGFQKKHIPYVAGGALFLILVGWIVFGDHASTLKVDARGVNIGNVTKEQFNDFVRVNGQVQPITVVQLSPEEGGIVQEKVVEEGAQVKKGDVIIGANQQPVKNIAELRKILDSKPAVLALNIQRGDSSIYLLMQ